MKVLAVENNPELLKLLTHLLDKEGFETATALGGREALEKFAADRPAIACLDILLEDASGYDICREMRKADADMPILLITSKSRAADVQQGMAAGATEYIVKPFDLAGITALMRKVACSVLARTGAALDENFSFGDISVFPGRLHALRGSKQIDLNLREVSILKLFHGNKGKVVANDTIVPYCWKTQEQASQKAVDWQIAQLRKKVEADPANPALILAEGAGYRFG